MKLKIGVLLLALSLIFASFCFGKEREGIVTIKVDLKAPENTKNAKVWIPYPSFDPNQTVTIQGIKGNFEKMGIRRVPVRGALSLFAEWKKEIDQRVIELRFKVKTEEISERDLKDKGKPIPKMVKKYLVSKRWIPTDGKIKETANTIVKGKTGILEKSRAVYDWIIDNISWDSELKGNGVGDVLATMEKRSGKCVDLVSLYVALVRSVGVPAREVFGLRLGKEDGQEITDDFHCWAEFYLPDTGWIPVDPSDVRRMMVKENLQLEDVAQYREYYFGGLDELRVALNRGGRRLMLRPPQASGLLNYFMYPYAEIDGQRLEYSNPDDFQYSVQFDGM